MWSGCALEPARGHAEVALQHLCTEHGLAGRLPVMQTTTGENRQPAGLGQSCRIAQALQRGVARLIAAPGRIVLLPARAQHHNGPGLPAQLRPACSTSAGSRSTARAVHSTTIGRLINQSPVKPVTKHSAASLGERRRSHQPSSNRSNSTLVATAVA